jgi:hypothetical protein
MAIDESTAFVTVRFVDPEIDPDVAVIVAVPTARPLAKPAVVMLAVVFATALQVTDAVRSCVELSVKLPVAVNCSVTPMGTDGFGGVTAMEMRAADVTVRVAVPKMDPEVAVMVEVPVPLVVARPLEVIAATDAWDEVHVAVLLMSCEVPSLNIAVALYCCWSPRANDCCPGETMTDCSNRDCGREPLLHAGSKARSESAKTRWSLRMGPPVQSKGPVRREF